MLGINSFSGTLTVAVINFLVYNFLTLDAQSQPHPCACLALYKTNFGYTTRLFQLLFSYSLFFSFSPFSISIFFWSLWRLQKQGKHPHPNRREQGLNRTGKITG